MRPIRLRISAFGPYAGVEEFDFNKLGTGGIYLITGITGAGKTTIFDAITYALYGDPSGNSRDVSMFRSKYAAESTPTEVELVFSYRDKQYTVRRNPEYERAAKRGEGTTKQLAGAELILPDGKSISKIKDVDNAIKDIIGIDRNQFCQIAMIAQGDFQKLLLASTKERMEIFRHIFKTELYADLQEKLKKESGALNNECEVIRRSIRQYIDGIVCNEDNVAFIEVTKAKKGDLPTEDTVALLTKLIADDEAAEIKAAEEHLTLQKQLDEVKARLAKATDIAAAKKDLQFNETEFAARAEQKESVLAKCKAEEAKQPEAQKHTETAAAIKATLPEYDEADTKLALVAQNNATIAAGTQKTALLEQNIQILATEISALSEEEKSLQKAGEKKIALESEKRALEEYSTKLTTLYRDLDTLQTLREKYHRAIRAYKQKADDAAQAEADFNRANKAYLDAQAGILADTLQAGLPCPVCGSVEHPAIAVKPDSAPTKDELDSLQKKLGLANNEANAARANAGRLKGALDEKEESLSLELNNLLKIDMVDDAPAAVREQIDNTAAEIKNLNTQIATEQKNINRKAEIEKLLPQKQEAAEKAKQEIAAIKENINTKKAETAVLEQRIAELRAKLTFESKAKAQAEIAVLLNAVAQIRKAFDDAQKALAQCNEKLASLKSAKEEILKRLDGAPDTDIEKETEALLTLEEAQKRQAANEKLLHSRLTANRKSLENINLQAQILITAETKYAWVKALSNTANGNIAGKEKIMLETYIQMTYFDRILNRANKRLMIMTDGQYDLVRCKEATSKQGQSGLDLNVLDHYNGTERSVRTLSGGESFKASLALALGLSDEIQEAAGGIRLDTMFVDEGFGSLDEDSLVYAIKALTSLADNNRLVGIISHVGELKQKIDKQIIVTKDQSGGSKAEIITESYRTPKMHDRKTGQ